MSARKDKGGLTQPHTTVEIDDEIDALEAVEFAQGKVSLPRVVETAVFEEDTNALAEPSAETKMKGHESTDAVARRLAMKLEFRAIAKLGETMPPQRTMSPPPEPDPPPAMASPRALPPAGGSGRDVLTDEELESILLAAIVDSSLITVPPAVGSVPPPDIPPAPGVPSFPYGAPDETVRLPTVTPALAATMTASRDRAVGRETWAVLISMVAIALPGALFLGQALFSHPVTARSAHPAAAATLAPEADAVPTTAGDSVGPSGPGGLSPGSFAFTLSSVGDPVDPPPVVRKPRHRGKVKSNPKPAPSATASPNDPSAK